MGIARGLAQAGARVAIIARNTEKSHAAAKALAEETGVAPLVLTADVSSPEQVATVVHEAKKGLGRIDILFNNAGISIRKLPQDLTPEEWHRVMDVNLTSAFLMSKAVYSHMKQAGGGKIINIGSMTSYFGASYASPYATSKGGIVQLSKSLALAWAADNIQVNALLPGWFETELTDGARRTFQGCTNASWLAFRPAAGPSRRTSPGRRFGWPALPAATSPAPRSWWTAAFPRVCSERRSLGVEGRGFETATSACQARMPRTTSPYTSVKRKSRPAWR